MQKTRQEHVIEYKPLPDADSWSAKDAAGLAINAAELANKYYQLTKGSVNDIRGDIDSVLFSHNQLQRQVRTLQQERRSIINQAIIAGATSAILMSIVWGLVSAGFSNSAPAQPSTQKVVKR